MESIKHMCKDIVITRNIDGELVVTSRQVAEDFEKQHSHVLRTIKEKVSGNPILDSEKYFIESSYTDRGKHYPEYLLTKDGFSFLVMGFTGAKADAWKLKYIEAFNKMEQAIKERSSRPLSAMDQLRLQYQVLEEHGGKIVQIEGKIDDLENNLPLFNVECKELQTLVRKKGIEVLGGKGSQAYKNNSLRCKVYSDIQQQLRREFQVTRYEAIKRCQFAKAKDIIAEYKVPFMLKDEIVMINNQTGFKEVI